MYLAPDGIRFLVLLIVSVTLVWILHLILSAKDANTFLASTSNFYLCYLSVRKLSIVSLLILSLNRHEVAKGLIATKFVVSGCIWY